MLSVDLYSLISLNGSYKVFSDISHFADNSVNISRLEGDAKFFDNRSLTLVYLYKGLCRVCFGWEGEAFKEVCLQYPEYDKMQYNIQDVIFRDAVLNEPSRETVLVFKDGTVSLYTGFAHLLLDNSGTVPVVPPKQTLLSPLEFGDEITCCYHSDVAIYVGTKGGLVYMYNIRTGDNTLFSSPVHISIANKPKIALLKKKLMALIYRESEYSPFTHEEIEEASTRGSVVYIDKHHDCLFIIYENCIIISNPNRKYFEINNEAGVTNVHGTIQGNNVYILSKHNESGRTFLQRFTVEDVRRVGKDKLIENKLFSSVSRVEACGENELFLIGEHSIIKVVSPSFRMKKHEIITVDESIVGYAVYDASHQQNLISSINYRGTRGLFSSSKLLYATPAGIFAVHNGYELLNSLASSTQIDQKKILRFSLDIMLHPIDSNVFTINADILRDKMKEKLETYDSFITFLNYNNMFKSFHASTQKRIETNREQLYATYKFISLQEEIPGLFTNMTELLRTDEQETHQPSTFDQEYNEDDNALLALCNDPSNIETVIANVNRMSITPLGKITVIYKIVKASLKHQIPEVQNHSPWISKQLKQIKEVVNGVIGYISSLPPHNGKRYPEDVDSIVKRLCDICVTLENNKIRIGGLLESCLSIAPIPRFVPLLAKRVGEFGIYIRATYYGKKDLTDEDIIKESTDYPLPPPTESMEPETQAKTLISSDFYEQSNDATHDSLENEDEVTLGDDFYSQLYEYLKQAKYIRRIAMTREKGLLQHMLKGEEVTTEEIVALARGVTDGKVSFADFTEKVKYADDPDLFPMISLLELL